MNRITAVAIHMAIYSKNRNDTHCLKENMYIMFIRFTFGHKYNQGFAVSQYEIKIKSLQRMKIIENIRR